MGKVLAWLIVLLILIIYVRDAMLFKPDVHIIQTTAKGFHPDMLSERYPILLTDPLVKVEDMIDMYFRFMMLSKKKETELLDTQVYSTLATYTILYNPQSSTQPIYIYHPQYKGAFQMKPSASGQFLEATTKDPDGVGFVELLVKPHQTVILPAHWIFQHAGTPLLTVYTLQGWSHRVAGWLAKRGY